MKGGAVPADIDGSPTDAIETSMPRPAQGVPPFIEPACPLRSGNSIQHEHMRGGGTIGCLVTPILRDEVRRLIVKTNPQSIIWLLSANHIIANSNNAQTHDTLWHPRRQYSNDPLPCAILTDFIEVHPLNHVNRVDAAVARPLVPVNARFQGINTAPD